MKIIKYYNINSKNFLEIIQASYSSPEFLSSAFLSFLFIRTNYSINLPTTLAHRKMPCKNFFSIRTTPILEPSLEFSKQCRELMLQ